MTAGSKDTRTQAEKFEQAAREHGGDEDEAAWEERLRRIAKKRPERRNEAEGS